MLSHSVGQGIHWDRLIRPCLAAYNSTVHSSTGYAPQEFIRAVAPRLLLDPAPEEPTQDKAVGGGSSYIVWQSWLAAQKKHWQRARSGTREHTTGMCRTEMQCCRWEIMFW
jgi:hypothetical protein